MSDGCGGSHGDRGVGPCQSMLGGGAEEVELRAKFKVVGDGLQDVHTPAIRKMMKKGKAMAWGLKWIMF